MAYNSLVHTRDEEKIKKKQLYIYFCIRAYIWRGCARILIDDDIVTLDLYDFLRHCMLSLLSSLLFPILHFPAPLPLLSLTIYTSFIPSSSLRPNFYCISSQLNRLAPSEA